MAQTLYVDTHKDTGSDFASGLDPKRPLLTLQAAMNKAKAGSRILVRLDSTFDQQISISTNGVEFGTYSIGTEEGRPPTVTLASQDKALKPVKTTGVFFEGSDNRLSGWDIEGADIGIDLSSAPIGRKSFYTGNVIEDVRIRRYAWAVRVRASQTTLTRVSASKGRMYRDGDKTATGANAYTFWGDDGLVLRDVTLIDCTSEDAWAYSSGLPEKPDGSTIEGWGNLENIKCFGLTSINSGTFCELGGRVKLANGTPANESARNIVFQDCLIVDPMGRVLYVNDRDGDFPINFEGVQFVDCKIKADDDEASPFFVGKGHGNLSKKLAVRGCTIVATAQHFNAGPGTDVNSIVHDDNIYIRSDGGKGVGVKLTSREAFNNGYANTSEWLQMVREKQAAARR